MRRLYSLAQVQFLALNAALLIAASPALGQYSGTGGDNALQGGVSTRDRAAAIQERQTMRVNLGTPADGFFDNGQSPPLRELVHMERVTPDVFRAWLTDNHRQFALTTQTLSNNLVVDVAGRWDHADKTLTKLGINYTHIKTGDISPEVLTNARVLIINCAGEVKRDRLQCIRDFVQRGGYLLSTDWALNNMLEQTFPGYVVWNKCFNRHSIYSATYINPDPVLARGCVRCAAWKLDEGAHLVRILRPDLVKMLVASTDLSSEDQDGAGVLACLFQFGKGYVLHMVGHFDNNAAIAIGNFLPDPAPKIMISLRQALAANFVIAGLTGEPIPITGSAQIMSPGGFPRPAQDMRQAQDPGQSQSPQVSTPPQGIGRNQASAQSLQTDKVPKAPGVMPPLAPERLLRQFP